MRPFFEDSHTNGISLLPVTVTSQGRDRRLRQLFCVWPGGRVPGGRAAPAIPTLPGHHSSHRTMTRTEASADKEAGAVLAHTTVTQESGDLGFWLEAAVGYPASQSPAASVSRLWRDLDEMPSHTLLML